jgi:ribosomal protein S14
MRRRDGWIYSDIFKRSFNLSREYTYYLYGIIRRDMYTSIYTRSIVTRRLGVSCSTYGVSCARNLCRVTGRSHGVISGYSMGRMVFSSLAGFGLLTGISKRQ